MFKKIWKKVKLGVAIAAEIAWENKERILAFLIKRLAAMQKNRDSPQDNAP